MVIFSMSLVKGTGCTKMVKMAGPVVLSLSVSCVPYKRSWVYSRTTVVVLSPSAGARQLLSSALGAVPVGPVIGFLR